MAYWIILCVLPLLTQGQQQQSRFGENQDGRRRFTEQRLGASGPQPQYHHHQQVQLHADDVTLHELHQETYELPHYLTAEQQHHHVIAAQPHHVIAAQPHHMIAAQPHHLIATQPHHVIASPPSHHLIAAQPHHVITAQPHHVITTQPQQVATLQVQQQRTVQTLQQPQVSGYVNHGGVSYNIPTVGHPADFTGSSTQFRPYSAPQAPSYSGRSFSLGSSQESTSMQDSFQPQATELQQQQRGPSRYSSARAGYYSSAPSRPENRRE